MDASEGRLGIRTRWLWLAAGIAALVAAVYSIAFLIDEPVRRSIERHMNARLKGYTVHLGGASVHPHGFSLDLTDLSVGQDANPRPPVMHVARLRASVQWRALLHARLVANMVIDHPSVYVDLAHVKEEVKEKIPVRERGWQDALQAAYPLKINELSIVEGDFTYVDPAQPFRPLRLTHLSAHLENIRNIRSKERVYPSELHLETAVFGTGRLVAEGHADFLAKPFPGMRARFALERMKVDDFGPVAHRYNIVISGGTLSARGQLEYAPTIGSAVLDDVVLRNARIEYVHTPGTVATEREAAATTAEAAKTVTDRPDISLVLDRLDVLGSTIGFVSKTADPPYRVFFTDTDLHLTGLSNQSAEKPARVVLRGKFMGSGATRATVGFQPDRRGGDLDVRVAVDDTDMVAMNDLLRAYGKFDVARGRFSVYSEVGVRNGEVRGYVKPLFRDIVAYDPDQDRQKTFGDKIKERLVGGVATILKNRPRGEVATRADLSGRVGNLQTSNWQIIGRLIQNAFFKAILPEFDQSVGGTGPLEPATRPAPPSGAEHRSG